MTRIRHKEIARVDASTLNKGDGNLVSRALSSMAPNAWYRSDIVICTPQYKTYAHSLSFDASPVLFGSLQWSHGRNKSASRLLGHPVAYALVLLSPLSA